MSNLEPAPVENMIGGRTAVAEDPVRELLLGREVVIGTRDMAVTRTLPNRDRRMVGAWCFLDHYGPESIAGTPGMRVPPHPHTGLQTVSWLIAGEVLHRDSLGNEQLIRPGQLNLMTAGRAISHSEESPREAGPILHGVQLWVALPGGHRSVAPHFEHHADLPVFTEDGATVTVIIGELAGRRSPAKTYTPLLGAEVLLEAGAGIRLPVPDRFETAVLAVAGEPEVDGVAVPAGALLYLGCGRPDVSIRSGQPARVMLLGGEPCDEQIVMWWNFVGRTHEDIVAAREEWMSGSGFGMVTGYDGDRLPAPAMPTTPLQPRGRLRRRS